MPKPTQSQNINLLTLYYSRNVCILTFIDTTPAVWTCLSVRRLAILTHPLAALLHGCARLAHLTHWLLYFVGEHPWPILPTGCFTEHPWCVLPTGFFALWVCTSGNPAWHILPTGFVGEHAWPILPTDCFTLYSGNFGPSGHFYRKYWSWSGL